jgi:transcriptional regulator with XRE-family HTH domain
MSDAGERTPDTQGDSESARDREWADLQQQVLRDEVQHRKEFRELFETHEKVIAEKVRQLRIERGWSQEDLARRMEELGWPMHQTTVAKLEAAKRPIRAAEVYALAMVFGLPIQALWYLPVPGEPWSIERMREELQRIDDGIARTEQTLNQIMGIYADQKTERMRLARLLNDAAKSDLDILSQPDRNPDVLREAAAALEAASPAARRATESTGATQALARAWADNPELAALARAMTDVPELPIFADLVRRAVESGNWPAIARLMPTTWRSLTQQPLRDEEGAQAEPAETSAGRDRG